LQRWQTWQPVSDLLSNYSKAKTVLTRSGGFYGGI
jgi:hypothetical protein